MNRFWVLGAFIVLLSGCFGASPQGQGGASSFISGANPIAATPEGPSSPEATTPPAEETPSATPMNATITPFVGGSPTPSNIGPIAAADGTQAGGVFSPVAQIPGVEIKQEVRIQVGEYAPRFLSTDPEAVLLSENDILSLAFGVSSEIRVSSITGGGTSVTKASKIQMRLIHSYQDLEGTTHRRFMDAMAEEPRADGCNIFFNLSLPQAGRLTALLAVDFSGGNLPTSDFSPGFRELATEADLEAAKRGFQPVGELILRKSRETRTTDEGSVVEDPTPRGSPSTFGDPTQRYPSSPFPQ